MPEPWSLLALPPLEGGVLRMLFNDLPIEVLVPAERTPAAALALAPRTEILLGDWSTAIPITAALIAASPRLAFIQQPSVGVDAVDVAACIAAGIPVANAGGANAVSVAEWCVAATFAGLRSLNHADREMRNGRWPQLELSQRGGGELSGRRVGVVGMGQIGRMTATRFAALGCDVAHWSRTPRDASEAGGARWLPFEDLLRHSDVLVILIALAPETRGLIGAPELALLPAGGFVVNAARGGIVDEAALLAAVDSGALVGGALDVFETEPLPADSPLLAQERILLSPHAAATTSQAVGRLIATIVDNVGRALSGEPITNVVNGLDPVIRRREA